MTRITFHRFKQPVYVEITEDYNGVTIQVYADRNVTIHLYRNPARILAYITEYTERGDTSITVRKTISIRGERARRAFNIISKYIGLLLRQDST